MRNQEAARYARWSAIAAGLIALIVAGVYAERALRDYIAARHGPAPVPATVQQQMGGVTYSFSDRQGTTFTIRASHATQFKEGDHALLQDVWVTIYGKKGDRNDNIHTQECNYQPNAGNVQCTGEVDIDVQAANSSDGKSAAAQPLHVVTSNITFNRETGEASTPAPVTLTFDGGQGRGTGLQYSSEQATLRVERDISFAMAASQRTGGLPVSATAANLEFHRDERTIALGGPVVMHQGQRELTAGNISIALDKQYHAQQISGAGNPVITGTENGASFRVSAQRFDSTLDASGAVQQLTADGGVTGTRKGSAGEDHFVAERVEFAMIPGRNLLKQMTARGGVTADSRAAGNLRTLKTDALQINFAEPATDAQEAAARPDRRSNPVAGQRAGQQMDQQRIESTETLGPATIESNSADENIELKAAKFAAQFGPDGKLSKLQGHSGVQVTRTPANGTTQTTSADELAATFGTGGDLATIDETGNVRLAENGEGATAGRARMTGDSGMITLDGSPIVSAAGSRTSAGSVTINQKTGEIRATGGVITTEMASALAATAKSPGKPASTGMNSATFGSISPGQGDAHISGETLSGSMISGNVTFRGHARLWQGDAVLDADQITVSRDAGKLEADGNVVAVFPQAPGEGPQLPAIPASKTKPPSAASNASAGPVVWQIRAQRLTFSNDQGMAHLDGGVTASSTQGMLRSRTLDVYFAPPATAGRPNPAGQAQAIGGRGLERVVAQGDVVISQNDVHGYAQQADYDAVQGKFVFSGGEPKLTDGNGNTFSGHSLTFDVASDTISIVSDGGSRTLTTHRVEK